MQSAHFSGFVFCLKRIHDFSQVNESVRKCPARPGFNNLSLDLDVWNSSPDAWNAGWITCKGRWICILNIFHFYALTPWKIMFWCKPGWSVVFWKFVMMILMAEMYETASENDGTGQVIFQYEISNWARADGEYMSRHNLQYWRKQTPIWGLGAGSHGFCRFLIEQPIHLQ